VLVAVQVAIGYLTTVVLGRSVRLYLRLGHVIPVNAAEHWPQRLLRGIHPHIQENQNLSPGRGVGVLLYTK